VTDERWIPRQTIIDTLATGLEKADYVLAAALGGSDASGRTDEYSDIDLMTIVEDERVEDAFILLRETLESLGPVALSFRMPEPAWHGFSQEFLRLRDADPNHFIDFAAMKLSTPPERRFLEAERHGKAIVLFDRDGHLQAPGLNWDEHLEKLQGRLETLRTNFELFQPLVSRAVHRGHAAEAAATYAAMTLRPLVELLRMRHCPERFDYGLRYLDRDLSPADRALAERLAYPRDARELEGFREEAVTRFRAEIAALDAGEWSPERPVKP
jgi:predicted nucleotidyltransferase